jgi:large subunit ribosomal protein L24
MERLFSTSWKSSSQKRKQRKYRFNAPLHTKHKFMGVHLAKDLREKYGKRAVPVRKDDRVKILRGQFKGTTGKVERVSIKNERIYMGGAEITKKDGTKAKYPIHPSNLMITELSLGDKRRINALNRGKEKK